MIKKNILKIFIVICLVGLTLSLKDFILKTPMDSASIETLKREWQSTPPSPARLIHWFGNIQDSKLSEGDLSALTIDFTQSLFHKNDFAKTVSALNFHHHTDPTLIFATLTHLDKKRVVFGSGTGVVTALQDLRQQIQDWPAQAIKLDFVTQVLPFDQAKKSLQAPDHLGLFGQALNDEAHSVILPEELLSNPSLVLRKRQIQNADLYFFKTQSYYATVAEVYRLYRGHRVLEHLTPDLIESIALQATQYLVNHIDTKGKFDYILEPATGNIPKKYNLVRHAGALYAMLDAYLLKSDKQLLEKINSGLKFLLTKIQPCPADGSALCVVEKTKVKLGGNALALVAMAKYTQITHDNQYLATMQKLATAIVMMQESNGHFISDWDLKTWQGTGFVSEYYPGEATLGLLELYKVDQNPLWLKTARLATDYIALTRDAALTPTNIIHDHWMLIAINQLHRFDPKPHDLAHAKKIVLGIQQAQIQGSPFADYNGGYYDPPRSTPAAVRTEGLLAAHELFVFTGDTAFANSILKTVESNLRFQLQTFVFPETTLAFHQLNVGLGGFQKSVTDSEIRIDYVQHNLSGLLEYLKILEK